MAKQQTNQRALIEDMVLESEEYVMGGLPAVSSEDFNIDDIDVLKGLDPPLTSSHQFHSEPWIGCGPHRNTENDNSSGPVVMGQSPPEEPSLTVPVRRSGYECKLCHKVFGTANALNKHLLTHRQERPYVCPICQRAFKRHDHLNGHMSTHRKRKPFRCSAPGCQKSYCDSHSLKRHYISQHGVSLVPPTSQSAQWEPADNPPYLGGATARSNYPPAFLPCKPTSDTHQKAADYSGFGSFNSYKRFAPPSGLQLNDPQSKTILVLDTWRQRPDKGPCCECPGELHPPQWASEPTLPSLLPGGEGLHGWDSGDFPVGDLQALEKVLSYNHCSEANSSSVECFPEEKSSQSQLEQATCLRQSSVPVKSEAKLRIDTSFLSVDPTASLGSGVKSKLFPNTVFIHSNPSAPNKPNPAINLPSLYSVLKLETSNAKRDSKRKRQREKVVAVDLPAPPLPTPNPASFLAPRRPRPRPFYLVSPSQVAMASFSSNSDPCQFFKGDNAGWPGEGQESGDRVFPGSHKPEHSHMWSGPSIVTGCSSPEPVERGATLRSPCSAEHMPLSPLVIPVSVPVNVKTDPGSLQALDTENPLSGPGRSKRSLRLDPTATLTSPPPASPRRLPGEEDVSAPWCRAACGYPSQLRSPTYLADHLLDPRFRPPPYTPPPMLSPLRPGTGLYFNTMPTLQPGPPPRSIYAMSLGGADGVSLMMDDPVVSIEPRINVGQRFQAEIPPIRNLLLMLYDEHLAQLVWAPWGDMSTNVDTQKGVTHLIDLCCSSVLPGGGTNTELALHCLHEVQGDILAALDLLLVRGDFRSSTHPLSDYHYPGSDDWSPQEKKLFCKALLIHDKDFQLIHSVTKSVTQCVEYYYAMKKLKKFKQRGRVSEKKEAAGEEHQFPGKSFPLGARQHIDPPVGRWGPRRTLTKPDHRTLSVQEEQTTTGGALEYVCQECGRVFDKVKSRSAHMKTHRQQEREWLTGCGWPLVCPADNPHPKASTQDCYEEPLVYSTRGVLYDT
ncbi:zinc finger protein 541 [Esox lucius]|uniref:zinc finger protein 541 n=1 Tax=Esox lucius TaxID=8010 RepID=UPI0014773071|nr:zinc finger protein 541 [Esox lucius]